MSQTITEKILAAHSGNEKVEPGQLINAKVDFCFGNDITAPLALNELKKAGITKVFHPEKIVMIPDHFVPNKDIKSAENAKQLREFEQAQNLKHTFKVGKMGIEHILFPQNGLIRPGELIIGADSHTCTYGALGAFSTGVGSTDLAAAMALGECWFKVPESIKFTYTGTLKPHVSGKDLILHTIGKIGVSGALYKSMEFTGETISNLSMPSRFTMCNMAIEAGGKNGIIAPDAKTEAYVKERTEVPFKTYSSDSDAYYSEEIEIDASPLEPQVAFPHLPENTKPVSEAGNIELDQVVIGSCTNGWFEDLETAAHVLKGKKVHDRVRLIVIPGTQEIYSEALDKGVIKLFIEAGAAVSTPTCGPCLGGHMGILADGEKALATTNRNFVGRMGSPKSEVYLSNPAVAAASAVLGRIASPEELH